MSLSLENYLLIGVAVGGICILTGMLDVVIDLLNWVKRGLASDILFFFIGVSLAVIWPVWIAADAIRLTLKSLRHVWRLPERTKR